MRPVKQAKIISSQLELLDEFKTKLQHVLEYATNVIQKGNSWIEETNNQTFFEINKMLIDETFECISQCQDITKDNNEECPQHLGLQDQDMSDTKVQSVDTLKYLKNPAFPFREENEYKQLLEKIQKTDKTVSSLCKKIKKLQQNVQEHKNETKETMFSKVKEIENKQNLKFDQIMEEFNKASNFMSHLKTENEDVNNQVKEHDKQMSSIIKTLHNVQEQIKEHEQKSETFMKQQNSTENNFSLRLDKIMKDIFGNIESTNKLKYDIEKLSNIVNEYAKHFDTSIPNLQVEVKDLKEHIEDLEYARKETEEDSREKFDEINKKMKLRSKRVHEKIFDVSSKVEKISQELVLSSPHAYFVAQAYGDMNVKMDLSKGQIVTSFGHDFLNIGKHYDRTEGIFTAPHDGLYLCSLTLSCESDENVQFCITVKRSRNGLQGCCCIVQTSTINSSSSVTIPFSIKQNDQVYITSYKNYKQIKLHDCSYFMCVLINKTLNF